jgi:hypothetical protein
MTLAPSATVAQGSTSAAVAGSVTTAGGVPLPGALITLTSLTNGGSRQATTNGSGGYSFALIAPGSYEIRAEALGYRPVVARTLMLGGGERASVALVLNIAPPPVLTVDTVALAGATSSRVRAGGTRFGIADLDGLPHRYQDLTSVAGLSNSADASLGSMGLPGSLSLVIADGVPFYRAGHPLARAESVGSPLFGRSSLGAVTVFEDAADAEMSGAAGGFVGVATRSGSTAGGLSLDGAWSGDPLWSSDRLDFEAPSLKSFEAGARATIVVSPGVSQLSVAGDAFRQDAPLAPRIDEAGQAAFAGLDPSLVAELVAPSVERLARYSGMARFDAQPTATSQIFFRGGAAYSKREFDGPGPIGLARDVALPEESVEFSVAGGWTGEYRPGVIFEMRAGVSGSDRTFEPANASRPAAVLVGSAARLGGVAWGEAEAQRLDVVLLPGVRWSLGQGVLKLGVAARVTSHTVAQGQSLELFYSDGPALVAGQGLAYAADAPVAEFSTREVGAYAQYDFDLSPALSGSVGGRFDYELLPESEASLSTTWLQASGLRNDEYPSKFSQVGARASLTWDPSLDGSTRIYGTMSMHHGDVDPGALSQLLSQDGSATSTVFAGTGLDWPMGSLPGGATAQPTLTLFGPDVRAPRSTRGTVGLVRRLTGSLNLQASAAYRRTDFLLRRRNLNRPPTGQAVDEFGRDVFGTLQQDGTVVSATGADVRRFPAFNDVWALDPDGWSEYWGVTGALEYTSGATSLYAAYTRSATTDNWLGGAEGLTGAQLSPLLPGTEDWTEGTSDFDAPDRVVIAATTGMSLATLSAVYRYRSGLPFTPRYRAGVDANGDGSVRNDVAYVDATLAAPLLEAWPCLDDQLDAFAKRNSCRGAAVHALDVSVRFRVGRVMGREASLVIDGLDVIETKDGLVDDALLLVDPTGTISTGGGTVIVPVIANPDFGKVVYPASRGRMIRIGFRIG